MRQNVRLWHLADMKTVLENVCFRAQSRHPIRRWWVKSTKRFQAEQKLGIAERLL
jgi:hypothetical protein